MVEKRSMRKRDRQGDAGPGTGTVGLVLAGGRSRRMGRDKASLVVAGRTLAARAADTLAGICSEVLLAAGGREVDGAPPSAVRITDGPGEGPAAGLLGAARERPGRPLLVLACDVPRVPAALLAELLRRLGRSVADGPPDAVLPRSARGPEPLIAAYGPAALAALAEQVAAGENAVVRLLERDDLSIEYLEGEALERFGDPEGMLANVNTPTDLRLLRT
jgi:molybdenum cofactor guanylyltransferase